MRIDILNDTNSEFPEEKVIRFFDFNENQLKQLKSAFIDLINKNKSFSSRGLNFVRDESIIITFYLHHLDIGIIPLKEIDYGCFLIIDSYKTLLDRIDKYIKADMEGYTWLYTIRTDYEFLLSKEGGW